MSWYYDWKPYVPVAERRRAAVKKMEELRKKGLDIKPVKLEGKKIARTFWGESWCNHLESFSDYDNRLPRGRAYVRNGSVCHLDILKGEVDARVMGSKLYTVKIAIKTLPLKKWKDLKKCCGGKIGSLLELLQGRLSKNVMSVVTNRDNGLFPLPGEISLQCSCPDWAVMCKHVAAVLYGVGARLDEQPELLFLLRGVDHEDLISAEIGVATAGGVTRGRNRIAENQLAEVFGIEMTEAVSPAESRPLQSFKKTVSKQMKPSRQAVKRPASLNPRPCAKTSKPEKTPEKAKKASGDSSKVRSVTGKEVVELRAKFGMSRSEFARLLGVSLLSVGNWEKNRRVLDLQARTLDAWKMAKRLTRRQAWRKLDES